MDGCTDEKQGFLMTVVDSKASRDVAGLICFSDMSVQAITLEATSSLIPIPDSAQSVSHSLYQLLRLKNKGKKSLDILHLLNILNCLSLNKVFCVFVS